MGIKASSKTPVCRNGHELAYTSSSDGYMSGMFSCDYCKNTKQCYEGRYNCTYCKFDVCNSCAANFKPAPYPIYNCKSGHTLIYSESQYSTGQYTCDACKRTGNCALGRWNCPYCNYDICAFCRPPGPMPGPMPGPNPYPVPGPMPNPYPVPGPVPYPYPMPGPMPGPYPIPGPVPNPNPVVYKTHCPSGHFLYDCTSSDGYMDGMFSCNECHNSGYCGAGRFACLTCKYDLCKSCKPN